MPTFRNIVPTKGPQNIPYSIIIPAAGMGYRMKTYGPKCLLTINGTSILDRQLNIIRSSLMQHEIILVGGFKEDRIRRKYKKGLKIVSNPRYEYTNVTASIGIGLEAAKHKNVIILYGDLVFNPQLFNIPIGQESLVVIDPNNNMGSGEVGCIVQDNILVRMMYSIPNKWAHFAYFCEKELFMLKEICKDPKYKEYYGFEIINIILNSGGHFGVYSPTNLLVTDIDSNKDIEFAESMLK